jgi:DNA-binding SARP family transcriptional activator/tetratricopeptide (TPR) repeat protein
MVIELKVLGPFEAVAGDTRLTLGGPAQRALLALLVLEANDVVSTSTIIHSLWGDDAPSSATGIVRTYVWRLRQALSEVDGIILAGRPPGYVLEVDPDRVDAHRFHRLATEARRRLDAGRPDEALALLDEALGLWSGDALADLDAFESLRPTIVRLEQLRLTAVDDRIDARLALGHHAALIGDLEALTRQEPYRERRWCQLMVALYRSGRQADALAAYQSVRAILVDEVGVEPGPELRTLEREVLEQSVDLRWVAPPGPPAAETPREPPRPTPPVIVEGPRAGRFVGRADERARLARALDETRAGRFGAVFIGGPPGIGKTALTTQVAGEARASGMAVLIGRADEDAGAPLQPVNEAIAQWAAHTPAGGLTRLGATGVDELSRIVPALIGEAPADPHRRDPDGRRRLFESIVRWVETVGEDRPTVVVLEDLHWADPAALLALRHLVRRPPATGVLLLGTYRDTELGVQATPAGFDHVGPLTDLLADTRGEPHVHHVRLDGFAEGDVVDLLRGEGGGELDEAGRGLAAQLSRTTGGNPLFVVETLRHLTERGAISPGRGRWANPPLETFGVPSAVTEVIARRLGRLPTTTGSLLAAAAVLGEHFDLAAVGRMVSISPMAALEALEPAIAAQLIAGEGLFGSSFAFSHALVRRAILEGLGPSQRTRLHWRAGEALAALHAADPGPRRGQIAYHLAAGVHAGDPHTAIEANVRAGDHALHALAFEDACARYTTATKLIAATGADDELLAYQAWMGIGATSRGEAEHHATCFLRAATIAREQGWNDLLAAAVLGLVAQSVISPDRLEVATARSLVDGTLEHLQDKPPTVDYCVLLAVMAARAIVAQQIEPARDLAALAEKAADNIGDRDSRVAAAMARCWTLLGEPHPDELNAAVTDAMAPVDGIGYHVLVRMFLLAVIPVPALQLGDRRRFEAARDQVASQPETRGSLHSAINVTLWDAALALCAGDFAEVRRLHGTVPDAEGVPNWEASAQLQATISYLERGEPGDIRPQLVRFAAFLPDAVHLRATIALLHAQEGDHAAAVAEIERLRRQRDFDQLGWGGPITLRFLAETVALIEAPALAAELLPVLSAYGGQLLVSFSGITIDGAADRAIGQLLLALGRPDEAVERLAAADALERSFGAHALTTRTRYWHALALTRTGRPDDREAAWRLATRAADDARRLGMAGLERDLVGLGPF